jgi:AraC-like DNA-binding protein
MTPIELVVRTVASTSALVLAGAFLRPADVRGVPRVFGTLLCIGAAGYTASYGSPGVGSVWVNLLGALLTGGIPFFFWGWVCSIMDDDFHLTARGLLAGLALIGIDVCLATTTGITLHGWGIASHSVLGLAFVAAALSNVVRGRRADLIESRRRLRLAVVVLAGGCTTTLLTVELFLHARTPPGEVQLMNVLMLALLLFGLACAIVGPSPTASAVFGCSSPVRPPLAEPANVAVNDPDGSLIDKLKHLMTAQAAYRDPQVTVTSLAKRLGVSEKRMREVINQRLGHKNFSSFVNAFRLEEVRRRLWDPRHDHLPILTLALDAGFGSVGAFNRAFKSTYGLTPSECRAKCEGGDVLSGDTIDAAARR